MGFIKKLVKKAQGKSPGEHPLKDKLKDLGHQVTHPAETIKNVANNIKTEVKKAAGKLADAAVFVPLKLYQPVMRKALEVKGVKTSASDKPQKVAGLFYKHIVRAGNHLEHLTEQEIQEGAEMLARDSGVPGAETGVKIVKVIIDFLRGMGKKAKGEKLTVEEIQAVGTTPVDPVLVKDFDKASDIITDTTGGVNSEGDTKFVNNKGEVSHILTKNGNVIETGAKSDLPKSKREKANIGSGILGIIRRPGKAPKDPVKKELVSKIIGKGKGIPNFDADKKTLEKKSVIELQQIWDKMNYDPKKEATKVGTPGRLINPDLLKNKGIQNLAEEAESYLYRNPQLYDFDRRG